MTIKLFLRAGVEFFVLFNHIIITKYTQIHVHHSLSNKGPFTNYVNQELGKVREGSAKC